MADAIDQAISLLESEQAHLNKALDALRSVRESRNGGNPVADKARPSSGKTPLSEDSTNKEAVDTVLSVTGGEVKTSQIVEKAKELGKTGIKRGSVRWTLHNGVEEGRYVKEKDGRANVYWLAGDK